MFKLGICTNFSIPHIGGTEYVLHNISKKLVKNYDYEVNVFSFSNKKELKIDNINIIPCKKGSYFINQINQMDHIMVYSDSFWQWENIVNNINIIKPKISIALVGMYHMRHNKIIFNKFIENINKFNVITHSNNYQDYYNCEKNNIPVSVIPNGIDLNEFDKYNNINFREKYNIKEKYIILNISNYFYGKGIDIIGDIAIQLKKYRSDFIIVQISNNIQYPHEKAFRDRAMRKCRNSNVLFLRDLPRENIIAAYKSSDIFLMTSLKEVAPLVILESMAAKLSWISMDIGNIKELCGGRIINNSNIDQKEYKIIDKNTINSYITYINEFLNNEKLKTIYGKNGRKLVEKKYNWDKIVLLYNEVFKCIN